ncbi:MAG TPA: hypothetical protein VEA80_01630 [Vitreimonas sp.]|nr:hypothetical protein [Vitreimonas sp.]HYD86150.1 hypothetical protein [Vitreimonas sp.]
MATWVLIVAIASIALTGGLAFLLYRMNAPAEQAHKESRDGERPGGGDV